METPDKKSLQLTTKQKKNLRGLAHHLKPLAYIGREGITVNSAKAVRQALKAHELIKVKLGQNCPVEKQLAAEQLASQSNAVLVQLIGKMVILYRPNPDLPKDRRIPLR